MGYFDCDVFFFVFVHYLCSPECMMSLFLFFIHVGCSPQISVMESSQEQSMYKNTNQTLTNSIKKTNGDSMKKLSVPELYQLYSSKNNEAPIIIDVRTDAEYEKAHIPTAIHIPLQELRNRSQDIERYLKGKDKDIYLVCAVGGRSAQAVDILSHLGFKNPINVMGGTNDWIALGFPTEKGMKATTPSVR